MPSSQLRCSRWEGLGLGWDILVHPAATRAPFAPCQPHTCFGSKGEKRGAGGDPRELLIFNQTRRLGWQLTGTERSFFGSAVLCQGCDGSSSAGWPERERSWQGAARRRRALGSGGSAEGREMTGALWSPDKDFGGGNTQQMSAPGASSTVAQQPAWGSIFVCPRGAGFSRGSANPLSLPCSH